MNTLLKQDTVHIIVKVRKLLLMYSEDLSVISFVTEKTAPSFSSLLACQHVTLKL